MSECFTCGKHSTTWLLAWFFSLLTVVTILESQGLKREAYVMFVASASLRRKLWM